MILLQHTSKAQMSAWRQHLHQHPETGFAVDDTAAFVAQKLKQFGLQVHTGIGKIGLVGVLQQGSSNKAIGLRADMDALAIQELNDFSYKSQHDGRMHACGHDGHTAMLLGAAQELAASESFDGTAYFVFQPDEEHGAGAQAMIDDGLFERFPMQAIYGMHNMPGMAAGHMAMNSGGVMASEDNFKIVIKGRGGHASQPHHHIDPLVIAAEITLALQTIVSRSIDPEQQAVVSVTEFVTDGAVNVIPSTVTITGDCRSFSEAVQDLIEARMQQLVAGICQAHGAEHEFSYERVFWATINSPKETQASGKAALSILSAADVDLACRPKTISEDFASMLRVKAGCYAFLGNGVDSVGGCMLHNPHYDFNDEIAETGAAYWVALVRQELSASAN
jgi:hippurate hydrolase